MNNNDPLIGKEIEGYQIDYLLGHGGMGRVYRALDINLARYAAFKVMTQPPVNVDTYRKRFNREAQAIAKLKHSNIVAIYRFNEVDDIYYMAMEYVDGGDLRWLLRQYQNDGELIDYDTMLNIMEQISSALDYSHENGVIHRDIKPSNIMIARDGDAILTDFGLALDVQEGTGGDIFGSPHYIAPEQAINSAQAVPGTDFYALGVILFEMLTGSVPFEAQSAVQVAMAHISDPLPDPLTINPDLHPAFIPVLKKVLEKEPKNRYSNGKKFIYALSAAVRRAKQDKRAPTMSSLGTPQDRIAQLLPPLPQPIPSVETKPATQMASENADFGGTKPVNTPTEFQKSATPQTKRPNRIRLWLTFILLFVVLGLFAIYQRPERLDFVLALLPEDSLPIAVADNPVTDGDNYALIEGLVTDVQEDQGLLTLTVRGLQLQIDRGMPLHDVVQRNDEIRVGGTYTLAGDALRFEQVTTAMHNGEPVNTDSD